MWWFEPGIPTPSSMGRETVPKTATCQVTVVVIGYHVWIGNRAILLKGVHIPNDCIIGTASVVTKRFEEEHVCIAGVPAKIVKRDVSWNPKRLPMGE